MAHSVLLFIHICSGTLGLLSGAVAMLFRKGSHRHVVAGDVFVISMLSLGLSGAMLALWKHEVSNVVGGLFTCYLVGTAWSTARRRDTSTGMLDRAALLFICSLAIGNIAVGIAAAMSSTGRAYGQMAGPYFFTGGLATLAAFGDVRIVVRGGITGTKRVVRHLWRMCFAWFVASGSLFLARPHLFPVVMRKTYMLVFLGFLPLLLMIFWLLRVSVAKAYRKKPLVATRASA
jgi:hypothetical protein